MRQSIAMKGEYPHRFVWFMECDKCGHASDPYWHQPSLGLFRIQGWDITEHGKPAYDLCPTCRLVQKQEKK